MGKEKGHSSRMKRELIKEAIEMGSGIDKYNKYRICERVIEIMMERYHGQSLEYHSERMGLNTNRKILDEIEDCFYRGYI